MRKATSLAAIAACAALSAGAAEYRIDLRGGEMPAQGVAFAVGDTIAVRLADGEEFALAVTAAPPAGVAGRSFIARDAARGVSAVVKPSAKGLRVTIDDFANAKIYTIKTADGKAEATVEDVAESLPDECGTCEGEACAHDEEESAAPVRKIARKAAAAGDDAFEMAVHNPVIDILVVFDKGAKAYAQERYGSMEECADAAVARMNDVLEHSQLLGRFSYRLAGVIDVDATYPAVNGDVLGALRSGGGVFGAIPAKRMACGADTTVLLVNRTGGSTSGISYSLEKDVSAEKIAAMAANNINYSVCDINTVFLRYTMSHEVGHQMGAGHSNIQDSSPGPQTTEYSSGYHFLDAKGVRCHTVMAYNYATFNGTYYNDFKSVPYFSTPDITPEDIGVPVGTEVNDNRRVLLQTYEGASNWREHKIPYEWDVRFLDDDGNDIADGAYFAYPGYVTLYHPDPNATIYYTRDGSVPDTKSNSCKSGQRFTLYETTVFTACAVIDGVAQSVCKVTMNEGLTWSGEAGMNGNGTWAEDASILAWHGGRKAFDKYSSVAFLDLEGTDVAEVEVIGAVAPYAATFAATQSAYVFNDGGNALVTLPGDAFTPAGDVAFNIPLNISATEITNAANHTLVFGAPFGPGVAAGATAGSYAGKITAGGNMASVVIAPGKGKTQTLAQMNNSYTYSDSTLKIGEGTVVFTGAGNVNGLFQNTAIEVLDGGNLVFQGNDETGYTKSDKHLTVRRGGAVTFTGNDMFGRILDLEGAMVTLAANLRNSRAFEFYGGPTVNVSADSAFVATKNPVVFLREGSPRFVLSGNATMESNLVFADGTANYANATGGIAVEGEGKFVQNSYGGAALTYKGATAIGGGVTFKLNATHKNAGAYTVAGGARLAGTGAITGDGAARLESGAKLCGSLAVKNLVCASGAMLGDQWNSVSAVVTGSLATAADGAAVAVTNGTLAIGAECDTSAFVTAELAIYDAGLVLSNDLAVAKLFCRNSTVALANGATLTLAQRGIDLPGEFTIELLDEPTQETTCSPCV
ncbi:MAG: chitobiase/beta-hexosaminidase C-terminal domain-containing protein, partial [Kiritimatiellae bacterium]|nr:chitobiase/beta-hexosaminidase C-terminal domain-containing protein [Kiritimatiellia bacterium]